MQTHVKLPASTCEKTVKSSHDIMLLHKQYAFSEHGQTESRCHADHAGTDDDYIVVLPVQGFGFPMRFGQVASVAKT